MNYVVENGPWMVNNKPLVVQKCALASRIGKPLIMDAMTATMCKLGVGRIGYARVLVKVKANKGLPENIDVSSSGKGNDNEGFMEVRNKRVEQQKVGNKQKPINQVIKNEKNGGVINNQVYRPKVINNDKVNEGGYVEVNNVGVIGQKLKKCYSKNGEKNQSSTTGMSQPNKYYVLNDYKEGECVEMEGMLNRDQVDVFISMKKQPTLKEMQGWNHDMICYFKKRWELLIDMNTQNENKKETYSPPFTIPQRMNSNEEVDVVYDMNNGMAKSMNVEDIRGMGSSSTQDEVVNIIREEKLNVCVILETYLKSNQLEKVCGMVLGT
uniref:DUF4283 domain-containing protein n=1 Tax=Tanacetum cinerariifolium TaxID=118510 RepID=A0A6L2K5B2_TANCI|nr:hypothetical protein [Tanacetum cinerariifolium]